MAFNFNWSPLTADASFYTRAKELLTTALNKSPKPPIIVDDILVNELNLGSIPPELEILEIGDLAEDRFRGIFKMCYTGDAFLTLKTRVQVRHSSGAVQMKTNIYLGQPTEHLPFYYSLLYISATTRRVLKSYYSLANHSLRIQNVSFYNIGVFTPKRPHISFPQRSSRIPQSLIYFRLHPIRSRLPAEGD